MTMVLGHDKVLRPVYDRPGLAQQACAAERRARQRHNNVRDRTFGLCVATESFMSGHDSQASWVV